MPQSEDQPSQFRTGRIILAIIGLVIAIFAAVWLYELAKVAPYM